MKPLAYLCRFGFDSNPRNLWDKFTTLIACIVVIFLTAGLTRVLAMDSPILLASMGASAAILFVMPGSPIAQPWSLLGGHLSSGLVGIWLAHIIDDRVLASGMTVGVSVLAMQMLRCLHPPAVATALIPVLNYPRTSQANFEFLLQPLSVNVTSLLLLALIINRLLLHRNYPTRVNPAKTADLQQPTPAHLMVDKADIELAVRDFNQFIDIGTEDLQQIFTRLQLQNLQKHHGTITCGDIMQLNIVTVEYATEVESAWSLMLERQLKVLPVLDRSRRVIGIVTQHDFLKNLQLTPYADFENNWLTFIKRTPATRTNKPEAIGHIMTRKVKTVPASAPFSELIPFLISEGHRHLPIVDHEQRFVGLVSQGHLIAALFNQQASTPHFHDKADDYAIAGGDI